MPYLDIYPVAHVDFMFYENGGALIGVGKISAPSIKYKTVPISGAGIMGDANIPLAGMIEAMTVNIEFTSVTDAIIKLGSNQWHDVSAYIAEHYFYPQNRKDEIEQTRLELSIRPIETNLGTFATATPADASGTYAACRFTVYKEGKKVIDVDQFNQTHLFGGVDCAADVRKAIGLM